MPPATRDRPPRPTRDKRTRTTTSLVLLAAAVVAAGAAYLLLGRDDGRFVAARGDLAVAVLVERGRSGGSVAAPIAGRFFTALGG
jgi:hypothetical protein